MQENFYLIHPKIICSFDVFICACVRMHRTNDFAEGKFCWIQIQK